MRRARGLLVASATVVAAFGLAVVSLRHSGYTPGQVIDYAERRLEGHPSLQLVTEPAIELARQALGERSAAQRRTARFVIPPPPPRIRLPWVLATVSTGAAQSASRVVRVGPTRPIRTIAEAARSAADGDTVEIDAGDYRADAAVWLQKSLTLRAAGGSARLHAGGVLAEDKAIWVFRNGSFEVSGIDFVGARADDRNGAGIRIEAGSLVVRDCLFWDSDNGIMTGRYGAAGVTSIEIVGSEFGYIGHGDGQSHAVYVEASELFRVTGSYFHHANVGHLIKSRSAVSDIRYNRITDEAGGRASYEIDLPVGGLAIVLGNIVQQSRYSENPTLIAYGREGFKWPLNRLFLINNTLVNEHPHGGAFLRAAAGSHGVFSSNNIFVGPGRYHVPDGFESTHDVVGDAQWFYEPMRGDMRLLAKAQGLGWQRPPVDRIQGLDLVPRAEYVHPRSARALASGPRHPGAVQEQPQ
jgi:hypothetical protein